MNAVEIEEAVSELASVQFDAGEFPFAFLTAFGNRQVTVQRLRAGSGNASDVEGGVLQRNNIHMAVCAEGRVGETLSALRASPKTATNKVKFVLATDGVILEAEELATGEPLACIYPEFADHFAFFLPLAGISTVKQIKDNPVDIKATGRLNKLYVELVKDNLDWVTAERRPDLNHFMARLIFCMFAEDTGIFQDRQFSKTVEQMSDGQSTNTHEIIAELFRAMATPDTDRASAGIRSWADRFPFVNGGLFADAGDCPRFSRIARTYLLRAASLNWQEINPDIFGSMIQAVADDDERGDLGMHYTSVPNILKVLNPLFLDDLRTQLEASGDSVRKLRALRRRMAAIRLFDPACGSGNFLVIAYKEMREIEHQIVKRINDEPRSWLKLHNFYGIEIKSFAAEIARLALLIAEFQCDVRLISQQEARSMVLPLHKTGQIHVGNALGMDWLTVCPSATMQPVEVWDLGGPTGRSIFENNGLGVTPEYETYICGNPPYLGSRMQEDQHKEDLRSIAAKIIPKWRSLDYVAGWILKSATYMRSVNSKFAFVSTSSICEGLQVSVLWPSIIGDCNEIFFAHRAFKWTNLAANNAGVTVVIVGVSRRNGDRQKYITQNDQSLAADNINPYLLRSPTIFVETLSKPISHVNTMVVGNMPRDGGHLILTRDEYEQSALSYPLIKKFLRIYFGSEELIQGKRRWCLWISDADTSEANDIPEIATRLALVKKMRAESTLESTRDYSERPHRFVYLAGIGKATTIAVAKVSSERRPYLPVDILDSNSVASDLLFALYDAPLWNLALIASKLHMVWVATVCGKLKTDFRYSNTLGWNTFPVPPLTAKNYVDLTRCAEEILLAREGHFPATIADLYDPEKMPADLRHAHERNDETLERIYIGRTFRNNTERLEKLFDLYTKMTSDAPKRKGAA